MPRKYMSPNYFKITVHFLMFLEAAGIKSSEEVAGSTIFRFLERSGVRPAGTYSQEPRV